MSWVAVMIVDGYFYLHHGMKKGDVYISTCGAMGFVIERKRSGRVIDT
jgi:hypothetical protein